jgi:hypothetical protein
VLEYGPLYNHSESVEHFRLNSVALDSSSIELTGVEYCVAESKNNLETENSYKVMYLAITHARGWSFKLIKSYPVSIRSYLKPV